jgi:hypothetical protein
MTHAIVSTRIRGPEGNCPVQSFGPVTTDDGAERWVYFRARGSHWEVHVYPPGRLPGGEGDDLPDCEPEWWIDRDYGQGFAAGWMPEEDAQVLLDWALERWAAGDPGGEAGDAPPLTHDVRRTDEQIAFDARTSEELLQRFAAGLRCREKEE